MLIGGIPRRIRLRGLGDPLIGVAHDLRGRGVAVDAVALPGMLLGRGHSTRGQTIFRYVGCHVRGYPVCPSATSVHDAERLAALEASHRPADERDERAARPDTVKSGEGRRPADVVPGRRPVIQMLGSSSASASTSTGAVVRSGQWSKMSAWVASSGNVNASVALAIHTWPW